MSGGYETPTSGQFGELNRQIFEINRRLRALEAPDGTQVFGTVRQLTALIAAGLELFVVRGEDGAPRGVHYDLFGVVAALLIGRDHEERLSALEEALRREQLQEP